MESKKKSLYVCPHCGAEKEAKPGKRMECDEHSLRVNMVEVKKGIVTK